MPLRALNEAGHEVIASRLDDAAWHTLVADVRTGRRSLHTVCCKQPARPRVSPLGTRHFYHQPLPGRPACDHPPESAEHLALKAAIMEHLTAAGVDAVPEAQGDGWIADVLATPTHGPPVALEVQLSPQDTVTTLQRTERYGQAGLATVWIMRRRPPDLPETVPAFALGSFEPPEVLVNGNAVALDRLVHAAVEQTLTRRALYASAPLTVEVRAELVNCWSCGGLMAALTADTSLTCRCGERLLALDLTAASVGRLVADAQREDLIRPPGIAVPICLLEERFSPAADQMETMNCCPLCGAPCRYSHLRALAGPRPPAAAQLELDVERGTQLDATEHWCLDGPGLIDRQD